KEHVCPCCGLSTSKIHDYRTQKIKHFPINHKEVILILRKRRYVCTCGKRFYEEYSFLTKYMRISKELLKYVCNEIRQQVSFSTVAMNCHLSLSTTIRYFNYIHYPKPLSLPKVLCIDEFKGNTGGEKFQCILVDGKKNRIIDILPDRKFSHLAAYFSSFSKYERQKVKFFVSDMWKPYMEIAKAYFPNTKIIIDKYHFARQIGWAIDNIRKRLQKTMTPTLRKYYKQSRRIILTREHKLKDEQKEKLNLMLSYSDDLRRAHWLKEHFYNLCHEKSYCTQRTDFWDWIKIAEKSGLSEFENCAKTFRTWSKEILNAFKYGHTNGPTEGFNNKIKVLKRISYGFRNFERFRNRIIHCD
ncbi:ISL3 family transposase, partial [Lachnospiraceae bacterium OttesenSCG-928-J05]|nr:ISL3 family transposase [Lachnospiraceae bacterium OttesenSCG-928-J05]